MKADLSDLNAFVAVARAKGFRDGARLSGVSASGLSEAIRRLEAQLGVRLLNRTTRSVAPTEAGQRLLDRDIQPLGMGARGDFRHHAAKGRMRVLLPQHDVAQHLHAAVAMTAQHGRRRLVAARFDPEDYAHPASPEHFASLGQALPL